MVLLHNYNLFCSSSQSIYETSGWLALIIFGVPSAVISIVCYALCCMEPIDDGSYDGEDEDDECEYGHRHCTS